MVLAMRIRRIHHLTVAVNDLDGARATFGRLFSALPADRADVPRYGIAAARVPIGDDVLELASPLSPGNPVARFLQRKGEGFYNLALEVDDIDAAVAEAAAAGRAHQRSRRGGARPAQRIPRDGRHPRPEHPARRR